MGGRGRGGKERERRGGDEGGGGGRGGRERVGGREGKRWEGEERHQQT